MGSSSIRTMPFRARSQAILCATSSASFSTYKSGDKIQKGTCFAVLPLKSPSPRTFRLRIVLIRHAESQNNEIDLRLVKKFRNGEVLHLRDGTVHITDAADNVDGKA